MKERIAVNKGRFLRSRSDLGLYLHTTFVKVRLLNILLSLHTTILKPDKTVVMHHQCQHTCVWDMLTFCHLQI